MKDLLELREQVVGQILLVPEPGREAWNDALILVLALIDQRLARLDS